MLDGFGDNVNMDENGSMNAQEGENRDGGAAPLSFYNQPYPRVNLWKETIARLSEAGVPDSISEAVAFTNNAIQFAISRGDAHLVDLNDVIALAVALDHRAREMNVLLLDLAVVMNDIVLLTGTRRCWVRSVTTSSGRWRGNLWTL